MQKLALMTVGFIVVCSIAPSLLPLEALVAAFLGFVGYVVWRVLPR